MFGPGNFIFNTHPDVQVVGYVTKETKSEIIIYRILNKQFGPSYWSKKNCIATTDNHIFAIEKLEEELRKNNIIIDVKSEAKCQCSSNQLWWGGCICGGL